MAHYTDINDLLLTTNKGLFTSAEMTRETPGIPRPGDGVMVSFVDMGLKDILVHQTDISSTTCRGETRGRVVDRAGSVLLDKAEYVQFSYSKIAGIHRQ